MDAAEAELGQTTASGSLRALIAPHAGYRFSGRTAGYSYGALRRNAGRIKRIYVLGPSHHVYSTSCMLTLADWLETPVGHLKVDRVEVERLARMDGFTMWNSLEEDEEEHSIEMQLPYIRRATAGNDALLVVPITVGSLGFEQEKSIGKVLAACMVDETNVIVISSDFCHWGSRFRYQFRLETRLPIHQSIEQLDKQGMDIIETKDHKEFSEYLKAFKNTICGRHPIGVLLGLLESLGSEKAMYAIKFVHYEQSSPCINMNDSSVSYAAALVLKA
jgi:AmmeMemoRadiSam system protein B